MKCMSHNLVSCTLFWTSVLCIIDPELRDASVLVLCLLTGVSEFVVDFVKILTEVGKL